eukprot:6289957-Prymnesium_polylepis.2
MPRERACAPTRPPACARGCMSVLPHNMPRVPRVPSRAACGLCTRVRGVGLHAHAAPHLLPRHSWRSVSPRTNAQS